MQTQLERDVRFLKIYAAVATLVCAVFILSAFAQARRQKFDEIDVERINIVEKDGRLRMVISNRERQHPGISNGKAIPRPDGRAPGMIFFNPKGDESGGLIFEDNGPNGQFESLTFDKALSDQTVGLRHLESEDGSYFAGMQVWDRPSGVQRVSVGRGRDRVAAVMLSDANGKTRIRISVDDNGNPKMDFMDAAGRITYTLPR